MITDVIVPGKARPVTCSDPAQDSKLRLIAACKAFDRDGLGLICIADFRTAIHRFVSAAARAGGRRTTSDAQIEQMIHDADTEGDGQIDYVEFLS